MEVIIRDTSEQATALAAEIIAHQIRRKPDSSLGLATGRTMEALYDLLAEKHNREGLDFSRVRTHNLDEYIGLPAEDEHAYRHYMNRHLFGRVNIYVGNTFVPNGMAEDIAAECVRYEESIRACGGIDLQLLGIGRSGHIGFNEPLSSMRSRTRAKALTPQTLAQNAPLFKDPERMPRRAITMGVGTILEARWCVLLAVGEEKADIIAKTVEGPITSMISATALQLHEKCTVILDDAAGAKLQHQDYYHWIFENEPEWEEYR